MDFVVFGQIKGEKPHFPLNLQEDNIKTYTEIHGFWYCVPNWLLSRPFDLILMLCTQLTPFKTLQPNFIIVYPIDSFQDHWPNSRPYELIFALCTQLTPFKTIWPNFFIMYPTDSFQDHMTWFLYCVPNWFLSRQFDLILSLCTQLVGMRILPKSTVFTKIHISFTKMQLGTQVKWVHNANIFCIKSTDLTLNPKIYH